ncbi:serine hydrolase domain-containing protein [Microlunatus parietis]|uniref:CubicO group peptidase (Beta-lactamase class C family) n=1 Tax=Microlunatus parietis TaxID=682979 RepID=A0A7Y9I4I7_9ACTN|nr:serine hydrolase domain-containing protein [Microlunatus parietis]NYE69906.1 CubicO group peptidase (beta-lactamase class C family) [Microlunatus parietis]
MTEADGAAGFAELAERHGVPGAVFGEIEIGADPAGDRLRVATHGVVNAATGQPVLPDTVFQIGSITKPYTAILMARAIADGRTALDQPAAEILGPNAPLSSDAEASALITVGQLLTHRSGIDGDRFTDTGRGDDCLERYVAGLGGVAQMFRPGALYSYSNAGWVVAGRLLEILYGKPWRLVLRDQLIEPLGLTHTSTLAEEAILHSVAVGHTDRTTPVSYWGLPQSIGPAGGISATAAEVLAVAAELVRDGGRLLPPDAAAAMLADHGANPPGLQIEGHQGLGWMVGRWQGEPVFGHNGLTVGQSAYLLVLPGLRRALCLLVNGPGAANLWFELRRSTIAGYGLEVPPGSLATTGAAEPLEPWLGRYARAGEWIDLVGTEAGYRALVEEDLELGGEPERTDYALSPVRGGLWAGRTDGQLSPTSFRVGRFTDEQRAPGRPAGDDRYLYAGSRINHPAGGV